MAELTQRIAGIGAAVVDRTEGFGRFSRFCFAAAAWTVRGTRGHGRLRLLMPQLYMVGTRSIPVVMLVGAFVGAVLAVEMHPQFKALGQEGTIGGVINLSVVKQIGPVLAAVMIAGRVGGAVSAELGTMRVTEQIDALRVMGADPIAYLVVPRVIACVLMVPVLTIISDLLGVFGGYVVAVRGYGVNPTEYWDFSAWLVTSWDVYSGLIKGVFFGLAIGLISCYQGFHCRQGAEGVGRATTEAFVISFMAIIISNFFIANFLNQLHHLIWGADAMPGFGG